MKTDIKSLLEFAGVDITEGKAKQLVEQDMNQNFSAAFVLDDEGEAYVVEPGSKESYGNVLWDNAVRLASGGARVTWAEASRTVQRNINEDRQRYGDEYDAQEAMNTYFNFERRYRQRRGRVMLGADEALVVLV